MPYDVYGNYTPDVTGSSGNGGLWAGVGTGAASGALAGASFGPWGAAVGGLIGAGAGLITGEEQKKKANALLKQTQYPIQPIPQGVQQNAQQANRLALQGLPSAQYNEAMTNIQRQQANAIMAAQDRRSGMATVSNINQATNDAQLQLTAQDAMSRRQNIESAYQQNQVLGQYANNAFDWNQKSRYLQNYSYAMSLLGSGNQNILRGIDTGASALARGLSNIGGGSGPNYPFIGGGGTGLPQVGQVGNGPDLGTNTTFSAGNPAALFSSASYNGLVPVTFPYPVQ